MPLFNTNIFYSFLKTKFHLPVAVFFKIKYQMLTKAGLSRPDIPLPTGRQVSHGNHFF
jgi:hypothetical protein